MKKLYAALAAVIILLCAGALADEPITISAQEDGGVYEFTGVISENAEGAEYLYKTEYGFLSLNADGTYVYTYDASRGFDEGATDDFMISYKTQEGDTYTTAISVPAGENAEGTAVREGLVTENASFATEHCYIRAENGIYTIIVKNWAIQYLSEGETLDEIFTVVENGSREVVFNIHIIGRNDIPTAETARIAFDIGEDETVRGSVDLSGGDSEAVVSGAKGAKYGTLKINADGTFSYKADKTNPDIAALKRGETITDEIKYTVRDKDGSTRTGKIIITVRVASKKPVFPKITVNITEGESGASINVFDFPHTLGDGTLSEHTFDWTDATENNGSIAANAEGNLTYTPDPSLIRMLGEGETASDYAEFRLTDEDGDSVESRVEIILTGVDSAPKAGLGARDLSEDSAGASIYLDTFVSEYGDGTIAEHTFTAETEDMPSYVKNFSCTAGGLVTFDFDARDPNLYKLTSADSVSFAVIYWIADKDGDKAKSEISIQIFGETRTPAATNVYEEIDESDGSTHTINAAKTIVAGDGPLSGHTLKIVKSPENPLGRIEIKENLQISYTLSVDDPRVYSLIKDTYLNDIYTLEVTDCDGHKDTFEAEIHINGKKRQPTAGDFVIELTEGTKESARIDLFDKITLGNGPKSAHKIRSISVLKYVKCTYASGSVLEYTLDDSVKTLGEGEILSHEITYTVYDAVGGAATAKITLKITGSDSVPVAKDAVFDFTVKSASSSVSNEMYKYLLSKGDGELEDYTVTITPVSEKYGTVKVDKSSVTFTPTDIFANGNPLMTYTDTYKYTIFDADGDSSTANLTVNYTVADRSPQLADMSVTSSRSVGWEAYGDVLNNSVLGNGPKSNHTLEWDAESIKFSGGTFRSFEGGEFSFIAGDGIIECVESAPTSSLTVKIKFKYTDIDGDSATGTLSITFTN